MKKEYRIVFRYPGTFFLLAVLTVFLAACQTDKPRKYVIGVVNPNKGSQEISRGFVAGMKEYGYDRNTSYIIAESRHDPEEVIPYLVDKQPDLIFTVTTPATRLAGKMTAGKGIPVVFAIHDPVASGIIDTLSQPGGNLTGIQVRGSVPKALEWFLMLAPETRHLLIPVKYDTKAATQSLADLKKCAELKGVRLTVVEVNTETELEAALAGIPEDVDGLFLLHSIFISSHAERIVRAAIDRNLPCGSGTSLYRDGVTIAYGIDWDRTGRQAARLAHLILQGEEAGGIPAEVADFFLGVNLKTAKQAGLKVPDELLLQADFLVR